MKRLFLSVIMVLVFCANSFAASGKAIIPHYRSLFNSPNDKISPILFMSNITNSTISVKVTFTIKMVRLLQMATIV